MPKELSEIQRTLGRIEQGLKSLDEKVQQNYETTGKNITILSEKVDSLESFRDNLQGRMTIIGSIGGIVGGIVAQIIQYLLKKF